MFDVSVRISTGTKTKKKKKKGGKKEKKKKENRKGKNKIDPQISCHPTLVRLCPLVLCWHFLFSSTAIQRAESSDFSRRVAHCLILLFVPISYFVARVQKPGRNSRKNITKRGGGQISTARERRLSLFYACRVVCTRKIWLARPVTNGTVAWTGIRDTKDRIIASNVSFSLETLDFFPRDIFNRLSRTFIYSIFSVARQAVDARHPLFFWGLR